ncbi:MAG: MFS transporter [Pseudomonadota bacterium]
MSNALPPILISAAILVAGNGLMVTLIAVRASLEGFSPAIIGGLGTAYFVGFFGGCLLTANLIRRAGHIRVFAALAAIAAIAVLMMILVIDPWLWIAMRVLMGFASSGISMVLESWLNELAENRDRARVLSLYRMIDLGAVTGGQFLIPVIGAQGFAIFIISAMLFCAALLPVSLSRLSSPAPPETKSLWPTVALNLSPVACVACLILGLTNGAFRTVGPTYGHEMGLDVDGIALFMSLSIVGGALSQYPLGWLSDRLDRRLTLIMATAAAAASSTLLFLFGGAGTSLIYLGGFVFGAFALPLYSLSSAHANDRAEPGQYLDLAMGLTLFYALGAVFGPLLSSIVIARFGAPSSPTPRSCTLRWSST